MALNEDSYPNINIAPRSVFDSYNNLEKIHM